MHRTDHMFAALASLPFLACAPALAEYRAVQPEIKGAERLPRGPEATIAAAFLDMLNDGSAEAVRAFETRYRAADVVASVPMEERIKRVAHMNRDFGSIAIDEVHVSGPGLLVLSCRDSNGRTLVMDFDFDRADRTRLRGVKLEVGDESIKPSVMTPEQIKSTVTAACRALEEQYVFPEVARDMSRHVLGRLSEGAYDGIKLESALAQQLTEDFRSISKDKHLRVNVAPRQGQQPPRPSSGAPIAPSHGFKKVEILTGNIGYVRLDGFSGDEAAKPIAAAAMNFVSGCDAVIFDMRHNGGGSPEMIRYITSFIFAEPTHLNSMINRDGSVDGEFWTIKEIPGKRLRADVPIYVLTSSYSFSGAEEFTYNLKSLGRATVVGETTGGGAHPVKGVRISDRFMVGVPFMRAQNPITKTNWEGKGVSPDVEVPADQALEQALDQARAALARRGSASR